MIMKTLGLRHVALNVSSAEASKKFYMNLFGMELEWQPDPKDVFLTSNGQDNLALHERADLDIKKGDQYQSLDHIGFIIKTKAEVDAFYQKAKDLNVPIVKEVKQHRDGAYSFYCSDPDGYVVQVIFHPPISERSS